VLRAYLFFPVQAVGIAAPVEFFDEARIDEITRLGRSGLGVFERESGTEACMIGVSPAIIAVTEIVPPEK